MSETVAITKEEYEYLKGAARRLAALEEAGVDNWEGFDYAISSMEEE